MDVVVYDRHLIAVLVQEDHTLELVLGRCRCALEVRIALGGLFGRTTIDEVKRHILNVSVNVYGEEDLPLNDLLNVNLDQFLIACHFFPLSHYTGSPAQREYADVVIHLGWFVKRGALTRTLG